jgi:hypothetical protein
MHGGITMPTMAPLALPMDQDSSTVRGGSRLHDGSQAAPGPEFLARRAPATDPTICGGVQADRAQAQRAIGGGERGRHAVSRSAPAAPGALGSGGGA